MCRLRMGTDGFAKLEIAKSMGSMMAYIWEESLAWAR